MTYGKGILLWMRTHMQNLLVKVHRIQLDRITQSWPILGPQLSTRQWSAYFFGFECGLVRL